MQEKIIRFCYRKVIGASNQKAWDKFVFESSYTEFLMQSQFYNREKKYSTFSEMSRNVPGAEKLHFLVSASVTGYIQQLNGVVPDIVNNTGKLFLRSGANRFEIINSDIKNKADHQVAIHFLSEPIIWHDTIGNYLLISPVEAEKNKDGVLTHLVQLQPFFSIYSLKEKKNDPAIKRKNFPGRGTGNKPD